MSIKPTAGSSLYSDRVCEILTLGGGTMPVHCLFEYGSACALHVAASDYVAAETLRIRFQEHVYKCQKQPSQFDGMVALVPVGIIV